jgi:hypothetical protein
MAKASGLVMVRTGQASSIRHFNSNTRKVRKSVPHAKISVPQKAQIELVQEIAAQTTP